MQNNISENSSLDFNMDKPIVEAQKQNAPSFLRLLITEVVETLLIAGFVFIFVWVILFQPHKVDGSSMVPSFQDHEYILTNKISYRFSNPQRGDVVIFRFPNDPSEDYIKRIIGLPGEKIVFENGAVKIINDEHPDGFTLDEPYLAAGTLTNKNGQSSKITIPQETYFVLGDNRHYSSDSRTWGPVPHKNIIGKSWFRYWPFNRIKFIEKPNYSE